MLAEGREGLEAPKVSPLAVVTGLRRLLCVRAETGAAELL